MKKKSSTNYQSSTLLGIYNRWRWASSKQSVFLMLLFLALPFSLLAQEGTKAISFGKELATIHTKKVFLVAKDSGGEDTEVFSQADGYTYIVPANRHVKFLLSVAEGYVPYLWKTTNRGSTEEFRSSYGKKEFTFSAGDIEALDVDVRRLIPIRFYVDAEATQGPEVNIEEQNDYGTAILPTSDGETYLLPLGAAVYFDPLFKDGYNLLYWEVNGGISPLRPDIFYKQDLPEGFAIKAIYYKDGEKRQISYKQPDKGSLQCVNNSISGYPEVPSGEMVRPGDNLSFEVMSGDPTWEVTEVDHWLVNGEIYQTSDGDTYQAPQLSLRAYHDLSIEVVVEPKPKTTYTIEFGKDFPQGATVKVEQVDKQGNVITLLQPQEEGYTYVAEEGSSIRFSAIPSAGEVAYKWYLSTNKATGKESKELLGMYGKANWLLESLSSDVAVSIDFRELVAATFKVLGDGSIGKKVYIEEDDTYGVEVTPEEDGYTYMLPLRGSVYFEPLLATGYHILVWRMDGVEMAQRPDVFYQQNMTKDFHLSVAFYKEGDTYTVSFKQPKTAVLRCKNRSIEGSPEITSGSTVTPGDLVLFEVSPPDNPSGKVELHSWEINGKPYADSRGNLYTDNSLELRVLGNLDLVVVPLAETFNEEVVRSQGAFSIYYDANRNALEVVASPSDEVIVYSLSGEILARSRSADGHHFIPLSDMGANVLIVVSGQEQSKIIL